MSLYRQPGRRSLQAAVVAAVVGLCVGIAIGLLAGGSGAPSLSAALESLRERLRPASSSLELVGIEYREAVRVGRVVAPTEYEAARSHLRRTRESVQGSRDDLAALDPEATRRLLRQLSELDRMITRRADPAAVEARAQSARAELRRLIG